MQDRRAFLAAGAAVVPSVALSKDAWALVDQDSDEPWIVPVRKMGPSARIIPNVVLRTHRNEKVAFYDDLVRDKIVMINFMSVKGDAVYPVTDNLVQVQRLLRNRVGRDVFMYSITVDPKRDTPEALASFAEKHHVGPGWLFLTGRQKEIDVLRSFLFVRREKPNGEVTVTETPGRCCSGGLVRYGNESLNRWGSFPAKITPESIVKRFDWVGMQGKDEIKKPSTPARRAKNVPIAKNSR